MTVIGGVFLVDMPDIYGVLLSWLHIHAPHQNPGGLK